MRKAGEIPKAYIKVKVIKVDFMAVVTLQHWCVVIEVRGNILPLTAGFTWVKDTGFPLRYKNWTGLTFLKTAI